MQSPIASTTTITITAAACGRCALRQEAHNAAVRQQYHREKIRRLQQRNKCTHIIAGFLRLVLESVAMLQVIAAVQMILFRADDSWMKRVSALFSCILFAGTLCYNVYHVVQQLCTRYPQRIQGHLKYATLATQLRIRCEMFEARCLDNPDSMSTVFAELASARATQLRQEDAYMSSCSAELPHEHRTASMSTSLGGNLSQCQCQSQIPSELSALDLDFDARSAEAVVMAPLTQTQRRVLVDVLEPVNSDVCKRALLDWQQRARRSVVDLHHRASQLRRYARYWKVAQAVPQVILTFSSAANFVWDVLFIDHVTPGLDTMLPDWWGLVTSGAILVAVVLQRFMDKLDHIVRLDGRATDANEHAHQLSEFDHSITLMLSTTEQPTRGDLEQARAMQHSIQTQFTRGRYDE